MAHEDDDGPDDTSLTAEQYDRHRARIAAGEIPGGAPRRPTDTIRDAFDRARLDDLRGALEIHGWLTGEDSKEALDEIERAWGEIGAAHDVIFANYPQAVAPLATQVQGAIDDARKEGQRAAEEHNRRALDDWHAREQAKLGRANWTPERLREARERCEKATPGPWIHKVDCNDQENIYADDGEFVAVQWIALLPHQCVSQIEEQRAKDAAFIAHARADLPAALGEIERLTAELAVSTAENASLMQSSLDEIGRLTTALEQRRAPADASLEARAVDGYSVRWGFKGGACSIDHAATLDEAVELWSTVVSANPDADILAVMAGGDHVVLPTYADLLRVRAVDASRPGGTMSPDWIRGVRAAADVAASYNRDSTHPYRLDDCILAKLNVGGEPRANEHASRPGLTEEPHEIADAAEKLLESLGEYVRQSMHANREWSEGIRAIETALLARKKRLLRASRGETGPAAEPFEKIEQLPPTPGRFDVPIVQAPPAGSWQAPRCDKGHVARPGAPCPTCRRAELESALHDPETAAGAAAILADMPPPSGLTAAMHDAQQRPSVPPASPFGEWPEPERSGLTCPGCYAATGIATPCKGPLLSPAEQADPSFADALLVAQDRHREAAAVHPTTETDRQRATLHAGDPAAVQYCACGAAVAPGEDHPIGPRHDVARRPQ